MAKILAQQARSKTKAAPKPAGRRPAVKAAKSAAKSAARHATPAPRPAKPASRVSAAPARTISPGKSDTRRKAAPAKAVAKPTKKPTQVAIKPVAAKPVNGTAVAKTPAPKAGAAKVLAAKPSSKPAVKPVAPTPAPAVATARPPLKHAKSLNGNGEGSVARLAVRPQIAAPLAAERSKPVVKVARPRPDPVPVRLPPAPVRSDSKMAKNLAGITTRELEHFRDLLFQKRRELLGDVSSMETSALRSGNGNLSTLPIHMADTGTDNYEQEFTLGLVQKDRELLRDINKALAKIQDGSYGVCEGTGKPISKPRLEAQPWAKHSIEHARSLERPQFRRAF